jgi:predicted nucleotidyltransferase
MKDHTFHYLKILRDHRDQLQKKFPISSLALFGSVLRDDFNVNSSDIDVLVEFNGDIGWEFFDLENELSGLMGKKVDLVSKAALKPRFWDYIQKEVCYV